MVRALWLLAVASAVTLAALWIAGQEGEITVAIPGQEFRVSLAAGLFLLILFIAACIFTYRFLSFLGVLPQQLSRWNDARRRRNGYLALTRGLVATAAGDNDEARSNTKKALALMGEPPLALLLAAQSAQLEGNDKDAERYFTAMLQSPEMEFLGLRGLYMAAQRKGDQERALELAARAFALRPKAPWVVNALFDLQIQRQDWPQAALTLEQAGRTKNLDPNILRRRRAVLLAAQAMQAEEAGDGAKALGFAKDALAIAPGLTAAALIAAKRMALGGRLWRASAVLEQAWAK
ncbi:MAG TPA: heme biosynthesis protein HemY, partial [Alphaproteobacteria bacterium]|nr:heme biosynthesis protein HemY [Alphaproteobacteria bacterium]